MRSLPVRHSDCPFHEMRIFKALVGCLFALLLTAEAAEKLASEAIERAARAQIGKTLSYDSSYRKLNYPNGDLPIELGVCSDVVVRSLRASLGIDLQQFVHEDMKRNFTRYPQNWGLKGPDKNIDHRRVPNLQTYFKHMGYELPVSKSATSFKAGDLVTCIVPPNLPHIMIVSSRTNATGGPLIIHNIGAGVKEEDRLFEFKITGHYRIVHRPMAPPP
jgi:uncharacterized protein